MKNALMVMLGMFLLIVLCGGGWSMVMTRIVGGGVEQSYIYPLYLGIILLAGIVVIAATMIFDEIGKLNDKLDALKRDNAEKEEK